MKGGGGEGRGKQGMGEKGREAVSSLPLVLQGGRQEEPSKDSFQVTCVYLDVYFDIY